MVLFIFVSLGLEAQTQSCPAPLEPTALKVKGLIENAGTMRSVEDFLQALPPTMTSNFIFVGVSRSYQNGTVEDPRVVLTSPNGDVRLSFNTKPGQRGYNNVEISMWDPEAREFNYQELAFSKDGQTAPRHNDGLSCTLCHGDPAKPNWDPNNLPGAIPYARDTLTKGSAELGWYTNLLAKTEQDTPGNRLKFLTPIEDTAAIAEALSRSNTITRKFRTDSGIESASEGGISERLFNNLQERQRCSAQKQITESEHYPKFKYLLAGLQNGCAMEAFTPPWFENLAADHFYGTSASASRGSGSSTFQDVLQQTISRQSTHARDRVERQNVFLQSNNAPALEGTSSDKPENSREVAKFRYFLEPLGVKVSAFSTAIDPTYYSFGDSFRGDYLPAAEKSSIEAEGRRNGRNLCQSLAQLSRRALDADDIQAKLEAQAEALCAERSQKESSVKNLVSLGEDVIKFQAQEAFSKKCASCHNPQASNGLTVSGAPIIPFKNMQRLKQEITAPQGLLHNLGPLILDRINRPHGSPGSMPLMGITKVSPEETAAMNAWINTVTGKQ